MTCWPNKAINVPKIRKMDHGGYNFKVDYKCKYSPNPMHNASKERANWPLFRMYGDIMENK
jgi:hypothetical protein